jgi:hypothetical protein
LRKNLVWKIGEEKRGEMVESKKRKRVAIKIGGSWNRTGAELV